MDICVLSRVGGFRLGETEVAFTHIHKRCAERYMTS